MELASSESTKVLPWLSRSLRVCWQLIRSSFCRSWDELQNQTSPSNNAVEAPKENAAAPGPGTVALLPAEAGNVNRRQCANLLSRVRSNPKRLLGLLKELQDAITNEAQKSHLIDLLMDCGGKLEALDYLCPVLAWRRRRFAGRSSSR